MECPHCQFKNPEGMNFCGKCGKSLSTASNPPLLEYTHRSPMEYTPPFLLEKVLVNPNTMEGERKHVTVFFADVAGFTSLSETLDPEEVHDIRVYESESGFRENVACRGNSEIHRGNPWAQLLVGRLQPPLASVKTNTNIL